MIRKGMWCADADGRIGIANAINADGMVEFHRVGDDGLTTTIVLEAAGNLTQARYREIPVPRRALTKKRFAALGYH